MKPYKSCLNMTFMLYPTYLSKVVKKIELTLHHYHSSESLKMVLFLREEIIRKMVIKPR